MADYYFSGQGKVFAAERDANGNPGVFRDLGNVPSMRLTLETDILEHKESRTGNRLTDLRLVRERKASVTITLENFSVNNLKMLLYGTSVAVTGTLQTDEASPAGLAVGDIVALNHALINSAGFLVETHGTSTAWVADTDYTVDLDAGTITILSISKGTRIQTTYTPKNTTVVPMFEDTQKERYIRFSGLNTTNENAAVIVELYRVVVDPTNNFDLINDEIAQFELNGSVLYDSARDDGASGSELGGFGRVIQLT